MSEGESSTERFMRLMNEANERIAADEEKAKQPRLGEDPVRVAADRARREKFGQLRARPKSRSKTRRVRNVFGHNRIDGSDTSG